MNEFPGFSMAAGDTYDMCSRIMNVSRLSHGLNAD